MEHPHAPRDRLEVTNGSPSSNDARGFPRRPRVARAAGVHQKMRDAVGQRAVFSGRQRGEFVVDASSVELANVHLVSRLHLRRARRRGHGVTITPAKGSEREHAGRRGFGPPGGRRLAEHGGRELRHDARVHFIQLGAKFLECAESLRRRGSVRRREEQSRLRHGQAAGLGRGLGLSLCLGLGWPGLRLCGGRPGGGGLGRDRRSRPRRTLRRRVRRRLGCRCRSGRLRRRIFSLERC